MATLHAVIDASGAKRGADQFSAATGKMSAAANRSRNELGRFTKSQTTATEGTAKLVKGIGALAGGFALLQVVRSATKVISGYEESLLTLSAVAIRTNIPLAEQEAQFKALSSAAFDLGATTSFSAAQAADGLLFLARAGFTTKQSLDAINSTLDLAIAGQLELGESADFASNIVSQFGLEASETSRVVDTLVITANRSNTSVRQLAEAMKFAGPIAGALGISVEETAAALGVLGDRGIQGSMAGTNLRAILLKLIKPTGEGAEALKKYGTTVEDVSTSTNEFADVLRELDGLDIGDATALVGSRSAGALSILADSVIRTGELRDATAEFGGEAARVAKAINSGLSGSFRGLKSTVEAAFIVVGQSGFGGGLTELVRTITGTIRILIGMEDAVTGNEVAARALARSVVFLAGAGGFILLQKSIIGTISALRSLKVAFAATGVGLVALAIGALALAFFEFKDSVVQVGGTVSTFGSVTKQVFNEIADRVVVVSKTLVDIVQAAFTGIIQITVALFGILVDTTNRFLATFGTNWNKLFEGLKITTKLFANFTIGVLAGVFDTLDILVRRLVRVGASFGQLDVFHGIEGFVRSIGDASQELKDALNPLDFVEEFTERVEENFATDYVGAIVAATKQAVQGGTLVLQSFLTGTDFGQALDPRTFITDVLLRLEKENLQKQILPFLDDIGKILVNAIGTVVPGLPKLSLAATADVGLGSTVDLDAEIAALGGGTSTPLEGLSDDQKAAEQEILNTLGALEQQSFMLGLSAKEADRFAGSIRISSIAQQAGLKDTNNLVEAYQMLFDEVSRKAEIREFGDQTGRVFSELGADIAFNFDKASDALEAFGRKIQEIIFQQFIGNPLEQFISNLVFSLGNAFSGGKGKDKDLSGLLNNAKGNAFGGGNVIPFALGGVLDGPTTFPLASGQTGLAGEAGKEGLLPLDRNAAGQLSVNTTGLAAGSTVNNIKMVFPGVRDTTGVERSQRQLTRRLRRNN